MNSKRIFFKASFVKSRSIGELAWIIEVRWDCLAWGLYHQDLGSLSLNSAFLYLHSQISILENEPIALEFYPTILQSQLKENC